MAAFTAGGGSVQGLITALEKITDLCYPEYMGQGGTMVVPGHGWISDAADIGYYRDMVIVVRDRRIEGNRQEIIAAIDAMTAATSAPRRAPAKTPPAGRHRGNARRPR